MSLYIPYRVLPDTPAHKAIDDYLAASKANAKATKELMLKYLIPQGPLLKKSEMLGDDFSKEAKKRCIDMQRVAANGFGWKQGKRAYGFAICSVRWPQNFVTDRLSNMGFLQTQFGKTDRTYGDYLRWDPKHGCLVPGKRSDEGKALYADMAKLPHVWDADDMQHRMLIPVEAPKPKIEGKPTVAEQREHESWRYAGFNLNPQTGRRPMMGWRFVDEPIDGVLMPSVGPGKGRGTWVVEIPGELVESKWLNLVEGLEELAASSLAKAIAAMDAKNDKKDE
jgi:hypothetical protein